MTDLSPDFDFTAAANAAIEAANPPTEPVEEPAAEVAVEETPETVDRPRNPDGTFAPKDEPAAPDLSAELESLRKRLADKDAFIDRQGNELGELRKQFEERFDTLSAQVNQPAPTRITPDLIDADPAGATRLAWEQGDQHTLSVAFQAWKDEDPASAGAWAAYTAAQTEMQQLREQQAAELAALRQELQPISQANTEQQAAQAAQALIGKYGADQLAAFVQSPAFNELVTEFPWAQQSLGTDPAHTIESLFLVHRGRTADTLNRTQEQVARETAEQSARAVEDAYVASAATATATTAEQKTEADVIAERFTERAKSRQDAWNSGWERN